MAACEKCWTDAYDPSSTKSQAERYRELVEERTASGRICTPKQQAGDWWDEEKQCDTRKRNLCDERQSP